MAGKQTPLMKQYEAIKKKYPGALLLFRVGDFYETFGEDAITSSRILNITLTKRANGGSNEELAGFPYHALDNYLPKLVRAGQRVAICDQLEDPKSVKGIVKRGVTELVTPGVSYNDNVLDVKRNNYLAAVHLEKDRAGVSFLDISTGEFLTAEGSVSYIDKLLQSFHPSEVIFCKQQRQQFQESFGDDFTTFRLEDWVFSYDYAHESLTNHFGTANLKGYGVAGLKLGIITAGAVLHYLSETEHKETDHIRTISRIEQDRFVWLDRFTIRNLELVHPQHESGIPLIQVLDKTLTPMGGRMLRKWVVLPLKDQATIQERLDIVEGLTKTDELQETLQQNLRQIGDLERLISKVAARRISPREMVQLKRALAYIEPVKEALANSGNQKLQTLAAQIDLCLELRKRIETELKPDCPIVNNQGNIIADGIHEELDELRQIAFSGKDYLEKMRDQAAEEADIPKIKIGQNKVFGFYLEVSKTHAHKVPEHWIRKQTLVNAERYITEELKQYEEKIVSAEDRINVIEFQLFNQLVSTAVSFVPQIQQNAQLIAQIDCLSSFAQTALTNHYVKPNVGEDMTLEIKEGRHPVIESQLPIGEQYIPNDIYLDDAEQQIMVITGPNMAGKSALLRQVALITLMAQMGSFVPAKSANIGLVDKVFTRVGASDNLSQGESTFMVEMTETASILNNLSGRSLVLMDEIGRGTSTYDGISIAWAIVEYLHNHPECKAKTLFATHYHELNELTKDFPRIKNFNVSVKELSGKIIFMRKLKEGGSEHSFGINVAQMAGMPREVVLRANEILGELEIDKRREKTQERLEAVPKANMQMQLFAAADPKLDAIKAKLEGVDINAITPVEALMKLSEVMGVIKE